MKNLGHYYSAEIFMKNGFCIAEVQTVRLEALVSSRGLTKICSVVEIFYLGLTFLIMGNILVKNFILMQRSF